MYCESFVNTSVIDFGRLALLDFHFKDVPLNTVEIYANELNQIEIEVEVKILDRNDNILKLDCSKLRDMVCLCDFETGEMLDSPWIISDSKNEYTIPVNYASLPINGFKTLNSDIGFVSKYLSCFVGNSRKIFGVTICIPGIGRFDTSRFGTNTENGPNGRGSTFKSPKSLNVLALPQLDYGLSDLIIIKDANKGRKQNIINNGPDREYGHFTVFYDNYYISVKNGIQHAQIVGYDTSEQFKWIARFDSENNNQHMIVAHPFDGPPTTEMFGFFANYERWWTERHSYDLRQLITYNEEPKKICLTHMTALCSEDWQLPYNWPLADPIVHNSWFDFHDKFGNYSRFRFNLTEDHKDIQFNKLSNALIQ